MTSSVLPASSPRGDTPPAGQGLAVDSVGRRAPIFGVVALPHWGVIRASGPDAVAFLQGQLTQDVATLGPDAARLAAFCNAKGRMLASLVMFQGEPGELLLVCHRDLLPATLKRLSMFVLRAKVSLADASNDLTLYGLAGSAIKSIANNPIIPWARVVIDHQTLVALPPAADVARALCCAPTTLPAPAGPALDPALWQWLEVQSGIAMVSQAIAEALVPQMLNYESVGGVSFKKGCYPGQEVVARSQFRGTLKRRAYLVHGDGQAAVGQPVFHAADAEQPCGLVATAALHPDGGFDAIVSMQTAAAEDAAPGRLTLASPTGAALSVLALPYPLLDDI